jgi:hypothetical protein
MLVVLILALQTLGAAMLVQDSPSKEAVIAEIPLLGAIETAHAVAQNGSLVVAWNSDSLRVVKVSESGEVSLLGTVGHVAPAGTTRVMQLTAHHDSVFVLLSDRRTELVFAGTGQTSRRNIEYPVVPSLHMTHSPIGLTPRRRVVRIPILLPNEDGRESKGAIFVTDFDDISVLDSTSLGGRVVSVKMRQGPSLIYDSPLRSLYDLGTRLAISGDGSRLAVVDTRNRGTSIELDVRLLPVDRTTSSSAARWSAMLPLLAITHEEWLLARDSAVLIMSEEFENADDAKDRLGALAQPGGMLPAVRSARASHAGVVVELHAHYAKRARTQRLLLIASAGSCQVQVGEREHVAAVGSTDVWTLERKDGKTYARSRPLCEPRT